jgi:thioredoxin-related protein
MNGKLSLAILATAITCALAPAHAAKVFETDFEEAAETARNSNRYMLLDFSGSDWCGWCIRLDKEVFGKKEFQKYAKENLACVLLDFPRRKSLKKSLKEQNEALQRKYEVRGFPSVIVLSPKGDFVTKTGYREGGAAGYVKHLKQIIDTHRKQHKIPEPTSAESKPASRRGLGLKSSRPKPLAKDMNREIRTWQSKSGSSVTASIIQERGSYVVLKKEDGSTFQILTGKLSDGDQQHIADLKQKQSAE